MIIRFWNYIVNSKNITFYKLPVPLPHIEIYDRFTLIDEDIGHLKDPDVYVDGPYEFSPVEKEHGSCAQYKSRTLVSKDYLKSLTYDEVLTEYGNTLVMVASIEERWQALAPHMSMTYLNSLNPVHYCILELVGKGRHNGQMTVGKTNLTKIIKDAKLLFYNRKHLQRLDLIRVQCITQVTNGKAIKNLLLRLKRFYKPIILSLPKLGTIHNIVEYLRSQPDYCERTDVVLKKGLLTPQQNKRLQKTINVFAYDERPVVSDGTADEKNKKGHLKRKYIYLSIKSDDELQSDEETTEEPRKCQYKVGVNLLRQAYERFLEAGLNGLTQIEISQLLGIEFYTSRSICRILKSKKIVREFLEDKGRQRTTRYVAVASNGEVDVKYAEEKKKFLEYLDDNKSQSKVAESENTDEVPNKKIKLEETNDIGNPLITEEDVTEIKVISGLEKKNNESLLKSKKGPTLRQLKFANGLLKVTREKLAISGYQTLSNLVAKEIGEAPMDTKALKLFVQKLVTDGQLRILNLKWPGPHQRYSTLICAPNVNKNDPIIKAKYKEISIRSLCNKKINAKRELSDGSKSLAEYSYPRYMKIQKLHEFIINFVYFNVVKTDFPNGFTSLINVIPELTVEFAIGNISNICINEISHFKINDDILKMKLREAPEDFFKVLLQSSSLQNSIKLSMKVLAMLGLLQLIDSTSSQAIDHHSGITGYLFYVNRHAKIIDTTGIWPRENVEIQSLEKTFVFDSFENVKNYWAAVYEISSNTTIEMSGRYSKKLLPPVRKQDEVSFFDTGLRFGDGKGPCGFDSSFYMEIPRLWRTFYTKIAKAKQPLARKKPTLKKISKVDIKKKPKLLQKLKKPIKFVKDELNMCEPFNTLRRKNKNDTSIKWSTWDDTVIMMCKVAIIIMSPSSQPGSLRVRNVVAKDLLTLSDPKKCASLCHRRANTLENNSTLTHERDCIINELRRRRNLIQKYEGLLKKIRIRHSTNMSKFINEARIPMLELIWIIYQLRQSRSFSQKLPSVAMNIEDFHKNYMISSSSANRYYNMYKTPLDEPEIATLKEAILLTTMLSFNNTVSVDTATKIYLLFKVHSEKNLRTALEQLRKCGAIAAKEKIFNNLMHKFTYKDTIQTSYRISGLYQRRWMNRLNSQFISGIEDCLDKEFPQNCIKGSPEVTCMFCELQTCDVLEIISVTLPIITGSSGSIIQEEQLNVIDIEMKFKLKSGTLGWKNKCNVRTFSEVYEKRDYMKFLEPLVRNSIFNNTSESQELSVEEDKMVTHLKIKAEKGSTFHELQNSFDYETKDLVKKLRELESKNIIKRVGYYENRIVLLQYIKPWSMSLESKAIIPTPWITLDGKIRCDIFYRWAGVVMNKVFENPGCSLSFLSDNCEFLSIRTAQEICTFLANCECVKLNVMKIEEPDLFSDDDTIQELLEFNEYESPEFILIFPLKNALTQYARVRKSIFNNYSTENL